MSEDDGTVQRSNACQGDWDLLEPEVKMAEIPEIAFTPWDETQADPSTRKNFSGANSLEALEDKVKSSCS